MPKVLEYTPPWLCRPSEGYNLFSANDSASPKGSGKLAGISKSQGYGVDDYLGATRTIARRGTEVFVVVGNTLRWSDLCMLQEAFEQDLYNQLDPKASGKYEALKRPQAPEFKHYRVSLDCRLSCSS